MKGKIVIIIITLILIGLASYFYSFEQNRELVQEVYRDIGNISFSIDYRERHLYMYTSSMFFDCKNLNRTECRQYLSAYGWRLGVRTNLVRFNYTIIDDIVNNIIDFYMRMEFGIKLILADFGHYYRIWLYKGEVFSKRGLDPVYFPEPYKLYDNIIKLKLDYDMYRLIETPSVLLVVYRNFLYTAIKGWISGVWLLMYVVVDETMIQLILAAFLINFLVVITREVVFFGVNKLSGGTVKYWMFQKYTAFLQEIGLLDVFNNALTVLVVIRLFCIIIGLPSLFNVGAIYGLLIIFIYCFWYIIHHMQHKVKYEVELKIKADIKLKKGTNVELSFYTFLEKMGFWFLESFWNMTPTFVRIYRQGYEFRPFLDLIAPSKTIFWISLISLPIIIPVMFVFDIIIHTLAWAFCYIWLYPYVFNRRISETKWIQIMKSIDERSVIINSEQLNESDDYMFNLVRSWLLILGYYRYNAEPQKTVSRVKLFYDDVKKSYPENNFNVWEKRYDLPYRYLKNKFLKLSPTLEDKYQLFLEGLENDTMHYYNSRDIRLLWTKGKKDQNSLMLAESLIHAQFMRKFGKRWISQHLVPDYKEDEERFDKEKKLSEELDKQYDFELSRLSGYYMKVTLDFVPETPDDGFIRFVTKNFIDKNKLSADAIKSVDIGAVIDVESYSYFDALYTIAYIRYVAQYVYSEDLKDIQPIGDIPSQYYIFGCKDTDYCKTVVLLACILADLDIINSIKQSLITKQVVILRDQRANYFIKDAYLRLLNQYDNQEETVDLEDDFLGFEIIDYKKVNIPENRDYTEQGENVVARELSNVTGVTGSILTQLSYLKEVDVHGELKTLYSKYKKKLSNLKQLQVYPVYQTGEPIGDIVVSNEVMGLIEEALSKDSKIYSEFRVWLSHFSQDEYPLVIAWFIQNNKSFLYRFIDKDLLNNIIVQSGLDKHKVWFQADTKHELKKKELYGTIDRIRDSLGYFSKPFEDDDYVELKDMISPLMDLDYENMSKLIYQHKTGEVYKGLRTIGVQRDYSSPDIYMFVNDSLASEVKTFLPTANLGEYVIANPSRELVFTALEKYRRRNFSFDVKSEYSGYKFKDWLFSMLDNFYNVDQGYKIVVRDIESFSLDDLSLQSRKASPGFLTNRNGVRNKADKLDFTKAWAKTYRRSILMDEPLEHIWMTIVVPKTCKPGAEEVRVVNAPEMYFYINQFLIFESFVKLSSTSKVTNDFCLFFGEFDKAVRKHTVGYQLESLDLRHQGGRIQREIKDLFVEWYGRFMPTSQDKSVFKYLINDIFSCTFMIPSNFGGFIFQKEDGWCDGPYGTNQFDTWAMVVYFLMNCWENAKEYALDLRDVNTRNLIIESHGDNWLHSYPPRLEKLLSWRPAFMEKIGQEVKGQISQSMTPIGLELMGFEIKLINDLYVGTRPLGKTIKSLIFNHKKYKKKDTQKSYEKSIMMCLTLVDCWNQTAYTLLNRFLAQYASVQPHIVTVDAEHKHFILETLGLDPRAAWEYSSRKAFTVSEADPTNLSIWIEKD